MHYKERKITMYTNNLEKLQIIYIKKQDVFTLRTHT